MKKFIFKNYNMDYFKYFDIKKIGLYLSCISLSILMCASYNDDNKQEIRKEKKFLKNFYKEYKNNQTQENFNILFNKEGVLPFLSQKDENNSTVLHTIIDNIISAKTEDKLFKNDVLQKFLSALPPLLTKKKEMCVGGSRVYLSPFFYLLYQVKHDYIIKGNCKNELPSSNYIYRNQTTYKNNSFGKTLEELSNYPDINSLFLYNKFRKTEWWKGLIFDQEEEIIKKHMKPAQERIFSFLKKISQNPNSWSDLATWGVAPEQFNELNDCKDFFLDGIMSNKRCINIPIILNILDNEYKQKILMLEAKEEKLLDYCLNIPTWYYLLPKSNEFQKYYKTHITNCITQNKEDICTTINAFYKHQLLSPELFTEDPFVIMNNQNYSIKDYIKNNIDFLLEKYRSFDVIDIFEIFKLDKNFQYVCLKSIEKQINNNQNGNYNYIVYQIISLFKYSLANVNTKIIVKYKEISLIDFLLEKQIDDNKIKQYLCTIIKDYKIKFFYSILIHQEYASYINKIFNNSCDIVQVFDFVEFFGHLLRHRYTWVDIIEGKGINCEMIVNLLKTLFPDDFVFRKNNENVNRFNIINIIDAFDKETQNIFFYDTFLNDGSLVDFIFQQMDIEDAKILIKKFELSINYSVKNNISLSFDRIYALSDLLESHGKIQGKHNDFVRACLQSLNQLDAPSQEKKNRKMLTWINNFFCDNIQVLFSKDIDLTQMDLKFISYLPDFKEMVKTILNIIAKNIDQLNDSSTWLIAHLFKYKFFKPTETPTVFNGQTLLFSKFINALALHNNKNFIEKINPIIVDIVKQNKFSLYDLTHKGLLYLKNALENNYRQYVYYDELLKKHRRQSFYSWNDMFSFFTINELEERVNSNCIDFDVFCDAITLKKFKRKNPITTTMTVVEEAWQVDLEAFLDIFDEEKRSEMLNYEIQEKTLLEYMLNDAEAAVVAKIFNKYQIKIPKEGFKKRKNSEKDHIKAMLRLQDFLLVTSYNKDLIYSYALSNVPLFFKDDIENWIPDPSFFKDDMRNWTLDPGACFVFENKHPLLFVLDMIKNDKKWIGNKLWEECVTWILPNDINHILFYTKFFEELINSSSSSIGKNIHFINKFCDHNLVNMSEKILLNAEEISLKDYVKKHFINAIGDINFSDKLLILFKDDPEIKDMCMQYVENSFARFPDKIPKYFFKFLEHDLIDINMNILIREQNISIFLCVLNAFNEFNLNQLSNLAQKINNRFSIRLLNEHALGLIVSSFFVNINLHNYIDWQDFFNYITEDTEYTWQNILTDGFSCEKNQNLVKKLTCNNIFQKKFTDPGLTRLVALVDNNDDHIPVYFHITNDEPYSYILNLINLLGKFNDKTREHFLKSKINNVTLSNFILTEIDLEITYTILKKWVFPLEEIHFKTDRLVTLLQINDMHYNNVKLLCSYFFKQLCFDIHTRFSLKSVLEKNENLQKIFFSWFNDDNTVFIHEGKPCKPIEILMEHSDDFSFLYHGFLKEKKDFYLKRILKKIKYAKSQNAEEQRLIAHKNALEEIENFYKNDLIDLHEKVRQGRTILQYIIFCMENSDLYDYIMMNTPNLNRVNEIKSMYLSNIQARVDSARNKKQDIRLLETIIKHAKYHVIDTNTLIKFPQRGQNNNLKIQMLSYLINEAAELGAAAQEQVCEIIKNIFKNKPLASKLDNLTTRGEKLLKTYDKDYEHYCIKKPLLIVRYKKTFSLLLLSTFLLLYKNLDYAKKLATNASDVIQNIFFDFYFFFRTLLIKKS